MEIDINSNKNSSIRQKFILIYKKIFLKFLSKILLLLNIFILLYILLNKNIHIKYLKSKVIDYNFEYDKYEREIISEKMKKYALWQLSEKEFYFINGIIRKYKPANCLEIGVAEGGSSILILNAIKDIKNSFLISLDLNTQYYLNSSKYTGHCVKEHFNDLTNNWKLLTGQQPHKFLEKLNLKFDFLFLDTAHFAPGELINIIEALPFLKENAIVVLHDITYHLFSNNFVYPSYIKFHPTQIFLMTSLFGDKIIIKNNRKVIENIGAVFLYPNQKNYYLNYFLLLLTPWEYLPSENQIKELEIFIQKYYKNKLYLLLFKRAVEENKIYINKFNKFLNISKNLFNKN